MERLNKDVYFMLLARVVALRSTCIRRAVGCILVDGDSRIVSTGYNGGLPAEPHCIDTPCLGAEDPAGDTSRCKAIHAEVNAIHQAGSAAKAVEWAYVTATPCFQCARHMVLTLPRLCGVFSIEMYTEPVESGYMVLKDRGIKVELLGGVGSMSIDKLFAQMERFR